MAGFWLQVSIFHVVIINETESLFNFLKKAHNPLLSLQHNINIDSLKSESH